MNNVFCYFFSRMLRAKITGHSLNMPIRKKRQSKVTGLLDEIRKMIRGFHVPSKVVNFKCSP